MAKQPQHLLSHVEPVCPGAQVQVGGVVDSSHVAPFAQSAHTMATKGESRKILILGKMYINVCIPQPYNNIIMEYNWAIVGSWFNL